MPTPSTTISTDNIQTEFGGVNPIALNEYYKGGLYVSNNVVGVPTSGTIAMSDLRSKSRVTITASTTSLNEGDTVTFTITAPTLNSTVVYWAAYSTTGTTAVDILGDNPLGSFTVASNTATVTLTAKFDIDTPETGEKFGIRLYYTQADRDAFVNHFAESGETVTINSATYTATPAASNVNEGSSLTINVATTNITNGTTLYWSINHSTTASTDFSTNSGSFTITTNAGSFTVGPLADQVTEGAESFTVSIRAYSTSGTVLATTSAITVNDTSTTPPTYSATPAASSVNEGSSLTINVSTTNVANATTLYWTTSHISTAAADFSANSGSFTINTNAGSFSITAVADSTTEGAQTFTVQIRTGSTAGTVVATTSTITVNDTSTTPPTYAVSASPTTISEGSSLTCSVTTTNVANGTVLYWTINDTTTSSADFSATSGSFTVTSNAGSFTVTAVNDTTNESAETFTVSVRTGSTSGTVVATTGTLTLNNVTYYSVPQINSITWAPASVNEGSGITFTVNVTDNTASGAPRNFYYAAIGGAGTTAADFVGNGYGTLTSSNGTVNLTFTINFLADNTTEGTENFSVGIYSAGAYVGSPYYQTSSININDTSQTVFDLISITTTNNNTVSAGDFYTITVTTNISRSVDTKISITINQVYFRGNNSTDWTTGNITYADIMTIPANSTTGTFTGLLGPEQGTRTGAITASAGTGAPTLTSRSVNVSFTTSSQQVTGIVVAPPAVTIVPTSSTVAGVITNNLCWFSFLATSTTMTIDTNASTNLGSLANPDTKIALYRLQQGFCLGMADDIGGGNYRSSITLTNLTAGQNYWVAVGYYNGWNPVPNSTGYWNTVGSPTITLAGMQQIKLSINNGSTYSNPQ
jgi:hypothetical protein